MTPPLPNDDPDIDPEEIVAATDESSISTPPEVSETTKDLTQWDETPETTGTAAPLVRPDDEVPVAELLVSEGLDEADRDQRIAAADPDFEP